MCVVFQIFIKYDAWHPVGISFSIIVASEQDLCKAPVHASSDISPSIQQ